MLEVEPVQRAPHGVRRRAELQAHERAARLQHAEHLAERPVALGHVADAVGHGDRIVRLVRVGDVLRVHHLEVHRHAAGLAVGIVNARHVEHLAHEVGALDVGRPLRARHGERHIARAARDVQHVVVRADGGLAHHAGEPGLVRAEARHGVEPLVLLRDGREYLLHARGREVRGCFLAGGGVDAHRWRSIR